MFDRWITLIGEENFKKIQKTNVLLLGVGGVGGYVAEALVRSGIVNLTVIDGDRVDVSNLNRQLVALNSTIGREKVEVLKERLEDINPLVKVEVECEFIDVASVDELNLDEFDYIIDCIDDVPVKIALIEKALEANLHLISATGTARKLDPQKLAITTLDKTSYDPLAKRLRHELRGYKLNKVEVLASTEAPIECDKSVLGSSAFVPSVAGILIASHVIKRIISQK